MIVDAITPTVEEMKLSGAYHDGFGWAIMYPTGHDEWEFADECIFTNAQNAFKRQQELRDGGGFVDLCLVAVKAFNPCGINAD